MDENTRHAKRFLIGDLVLDTGKHEVSLDGHVLDLPGLSYQLIVVLAEAAPNVVSHDELVGQVWPGRVVSPETITQRISLVRQAIGDDANDPRYIGLVWGEGYRMLADVEPLPPEEAKLTRGLVSELGRRRVLQAAIIYAAIAWSVTKIMSLLLDALPLSPEWSKALVAIIFVVGFPVAMFLAWCFDIGPGGIKKTQAVTAKDRMTIAAAMALLVGATAGLFYLIYPRVLEQADLVSARQQALAEAVAAYKTNKSIAVLPFVDLSPDQDQEYFADGIAEELLDELTRLKGLNVASRTSSFAFKGSEESPKSIGEQLGVTSILEGSIRKDGDEIRVTTQLINAENGFHLWSKTFDRQIDDIFFVQEDIARSVAAALSISLEIDGRDHLPGAGTNSIEAYDALLAGRAWGRVGQPEHAEPYFERAVKLDPDYAEAWAALGASIGVQWDEQPTEQVRATLQRGRELVLHAIELNPELAWAWSNLAQFNRLLGDWAGAVEAGQNAAALAPGDIGLQLNSVGLFGSLGHVRESIELSELTKEIRPLGYYVAQPLAEQYIQARRYDDARATLEVSEALSSATNPSVIKRHLFIALSERNPADIRKFLEQFAAARPAVGPMIRSVLAEFESPPTVILAVLHRYFEEATDMPGQGRVIMAGLAAHYGDPEFALVVMTDELNRGLTRLRRLWYPFFSDMRRLPGFKTLVDELGLVTFWRTYSWPDFCRPLGDDDFECF